MSKITFSISKNELAKFQKGVDIFQLNLAKKTKHSLQAAGLRFESAAKLKTPVGTPTSTGIKDYHGGTLRAANHWTTEDNGYTILMANDTEYSGYVNNGTSRMKARPFFTKGFDAAVRIFKHKMKQ